MNVRHAQEFRQIFFAGQNVARLQFRAGQSGVVRIGSDVDLAVLHGDACCNGDACFNDDFFNLGTRAKHAYCRDTIIVVDRISARRTMEGGEQ